MFHCGPLSSISLWLISLLCSAQLSNNCFRLILSIEFYFLVCCARPSWLLSYVSLSDDLDSSIKCTVGDCGEQERVGCVAISPAMKHETITLHRNHLCLLSSFNTCHVGDVLFNIRWFGCGTLISLVLCMNPARCMWLRRSSCVNCLVAGGRGLR